MDARVEIEHAAGWYARTAVAPPNRPSLTFDLDVDVCVIGGGIAGLTAAYEIARRGWTVALLEAQRIGAEASGRNLGFVVPGFQQDIERIIERCGLDHAKVLWALSEDGVEYVRRTIRELDMPGVDPVDGWLYASKVDASDEMIALIALLGQEFGTDVEGWPAERVREVLKSDRYFHAVHYPRAFHIHPLNYTFGLAAAAEAAGARIFEASPAISLDPAGVRKRIAAPGGRIRASHVVLAANTQLGGVAGTLAQTVLPITTYVAVTEPLGENLAEAVTWRGAVSDSPSADHHYRIVGGDRLMWSGGSTVWQADAQRYGKWLKQTIKETYPQLGEVEISDVWAGTMGFTVHRMPQIGEVMPGVWLASGFAGQGLNTASIAGTLLARAIVESDDTWRLFLPYDLVWAGGALGRTVRQATSWWKRTRLSLAARGARRRQEQMRAGAAAEEGALDMQEPVDGESPPPEPTVSEATLEPMQVGNTDEKSAQVPVKSAE